MTRSDSSDLKVLVGLEGRAYEIIIGRGLIGRAADRLKLLFPGARFGIITDSNVGPAHLGRLTGSLDAAGLAHMVVQVGAGEGSKAYGPLQEVVEALIAAKLERTDVVVALGGGVIGDLAGFAASVTRRGMALVQVPTSLLAQVDSSVGGKTGINSPQGKNLVGAFHQPSLVLADLDALDTLPERQFRAGYAEIVKYGLIDDEEFFFWLETHRAEIFDGGPARAEAVARSCRAKTRFVLADEREQGVRALLNLGHTFGHALEKLTGYSDRLLHGEGVSIGMVLAHKYSVRRGLIASQDVVRVVRHLDDAGLPTDIGQIPGPELGAAEMVDAMHQDKKVVRGALNLILTRGIGQSYIERDVDAADVTEFLMETMKR